MAAGLTGPDLPARRQFEAPNTALARHDLGSLMRGCAFKRLPAARFSGTVTSCARNGTKNNFCNCPLLRVQSVGMKSQRDDIKNRFVIIMAGGRGERFWPVSRDRMPKQLLTLLGKRSFLQQAVERVLPLVPVKNIFVITNEVQLPEVRKQLPQNSQGQSCRRTCWPRYLRRRHARRGAGGGALHDRCHGGVAG